MSLRGGILRERAKDYRLSRETIALLEAIRRADPHRFLCFDELFLELARFYLARQPTLRGEVERWLREKKESPEDGDETKSPEE